MASAPPAASAPLSLPPAAARLLDDALAMLAESRPERPLEALAAHFRAAAGAATGLKASPRAAALRLLRRSPADRAAFMDDAAEAFAALDARLQRVPPGLTGEELAALLEGLCADFPPEAARAVAEAARGGAGGGARDAMVGFGEFSDGVRAWAAHSEFFAEARRLFAARPAWDAAAVLAVVDAASGGAGPPRRWAEQALAAAGASADAGAGPVDLALFTRALYASAAAEDRAAPGGAGARPPPPPA